MHNRLYYISVDIKTRRGIANRLTASRILCMTKTAQKTVEFPTFDA